MTDKVSFPPSLSRIVSRFNQDGTPRPQEDIQADIDRRDARAAWRKKNGYSRDSHWSVRRSFYAKEIAGFRQVIEELLGEDQAYLIDRGTQLNVRIAASQLLQRARARKLLGDAVRTRGRPRTPQQRLAAMTLSVEAYVGAGLRRQAALQRAADKWGNTDGRFFDVYKGSKLPQQGGSDLLRSFFLKTKIEDVDKFISQYRQSESAE